MLVESYDKHFFVLGEGGPTRLRTDDRGINQRLSVGRRLVYNIGLC